MQRLRFAGFGQNQVAVCVRRGRAELGARADRGHHSQEMIQNSSCERSIAADIRQELS